MAAKRLIERISPLWLGVGVSGFFLLLLLVAETVLGRWDGIMIEGKFDAFASTVRDVDCGMLIYLMRHTSHPIVRKVENRSSVMACLCARSITPLSTEITLG